MMYLIVDEAYAFDYLSILDVKVDEIGTSECSEAFLRCYQTMKYQMSDIESVMRSKEYSDLKEANRMVFMLIDKAKRDEVKASEIDRGNYERCKKRKALQDRFFGGGGTEVKVGYEVYDEVKSENN